MACHPFCHCFRSYLLDHSLIYKTCFYNTLTRIFLVLCMGLWSHKGMGHWVLQTYGFSSQFPCKPYGILGVMGYMRYGLGGFRLYGYESNN